MRLFPVLSVLLLLGASPSARSAPAPSSSNGSSANEAAAGDRSPAVLRSAPRGFRPADRLAWADELVSQGETGIDLAVAVLSTLESDPTVGALAADRLRRLLLAQPPRSAWTEIMKGLRDRPGDTDPIPMRIHLDRAWIQEERSRAWAVSDLAGLVADRKLNPAIRADAAVLLADAALRDSNPGVAARALEEARLLGPERVPLALSIALLLSEDRVSEARAIAGSTAPPTCRQADERVGCAAWLVTLGQPGLALRRLGDAQSSLASSDDRLPVLIARADLAASLGQTALVARMLEQASDIRPADQALRRRTGVALVMAGQDERAAVFLAADDPTLRGGSPARQRARVHAAIDAGRMSEAMDDIELQVAARPEDTEAVQLLIGLASTTHQPGRALEPLLHALPEEDAPWERSALQHWLATRLAEHGLALREAGDPARGTDAILQSIALDPVDVPGWVAAGGALWADGHPEEAREAFSTALSLDPDHAEALSALVRLLASLERFDEAHAVVSSQKKVDSTLNARLLILEETARIRGMWRAGERGRAAAATADLERRAPDDAAVQHALGDLFLEQRMAEAAARAYTRSIDLGDDGGWATLGLASTRMLTSEAPDLDEAETLLRRLEGERDPVLRAEIQAAKGRLLSQRAIRARERGDDSRAFELILESLAIHPDTWTLGLLGSLYLDHWQFEQAEEMYQGAVDLDARNQDAWAGLVVARMGRGRFDEAETVLLSHDLGSRPVSVSPSSKRSLGEELSERRILAAVQTALREHDPVAARVALEPLLQTQPERPAPWLAQADISLAEGQGAAALIAVEQALRLAPTDEGALGAALAVGYATDNLPAVVPAIRSALGSSVPLGPWVETALRSAELNIGLKKADKLWEKGDKSGARKAVTSAARALGTPTSLDHLALGAAWSRVGRPREAAVSFRAGLSAEGTETDTTAILGQAGAWRALGRPAEAAHVLDEGWQRLHDPRLGAELARTEAAMGHPLAAARAVERVAADPHVPEVTRLRRLPDPLPELDLGPILPSDDRLHPGPRLDIRRVDRAVHDPLPTAPAGVMVGLEEAQGSSPPVDVAALRAELGTAPRNAVTVSGLFGGRPSTLGVGGLSLLGADVAYEWVAADPLRLRVEALPLRVVDDQGGDGGAALALDLASPVEQPLAWRSAVGSSALGMDLPPTVVGHADLRWRTRHLWELALGGTRAPVIDSAFSFAGDPLAEAGRVTDNWLDLRAGLRTHSGLTVGGVGRMGFLDGLQMEPLPWYGAVFWLRAPFHNRTLPAEVGIDGIGARHSDWSGGSWAGEAGVYTPASFVSARARASLGWNPKEVAFCAAGGLGPQWSRERAWEPEPALGLGWDAAASATWEPEGLWWLGALGRVDAGASGWGSVLGLATLGYGHLSRGDVPGPTASAVAHGLVLSEAGPCPVGGLR